MSFLDKAKQLASKGYSTISSVLKEYPKSVKNAVSTTADAFGNIKKAVSKKVGGLVEKGLDKIIVPAEKIPGSPLYNQLYGAPKPTADSMKFKVGEGLPNITTVLPGPRISTLEAIQRGDIVKPVIPGQTPVVSKAGLAKESIKSQIKKQSDIDLEKKEKRLEDIKSVVQPFKTLAEKTMEYSAKAANWSPVVETASRAKAGVSFGKNLLQGKSLEESKKLSEDEYKKTKEDLYKTKLGKYSSPAGIIGTAVGALGSAVVAAEYGIGTLISEGVLDSKKFYDTFTTDGKFKASDYYDIYGKIFNAVKEGAKEGYQFGQPIGKSGTEMFPLAGLGKIPSAILAAPNISNAIDAYKNKDYDTFKKELAMGVINIVGAKMSKGKWIDPDFAQAFKGAGKGISKVIPSAGLSIKDVSKNLPEELKPTKKIKEPVIQKADNEKTNNIVKIIDEQNNKKIVDNLYKGDRFVLNLKNFNVPDETKTYITKNVESLKPELEKFKGPLTHEEVIKEAKKAEVFSGAMTREQTKKIEASLLKSKQRLATIDQNNGIGLKLEEIKLIKDIADEFTAAGRILRSGGIKVDPEILSEAEFAMTKQEIVKDLLKRGNEIASIYNAGKNIDWNDANQVTKFYREFVKPTLWEYVDEYRYINLLSSPRTHIVNTFSNILQTLGLHPATKLFHSGFDTIGSALTGKEKQVYAKEVPAFYKGVINNFGDSFKGALDAFRGKKLMNRPDVISTIPTGNKILSMFQSIPRLLEASDVFFSGLVRGGEREALIARAIKQGKNLDSALLRKIEKEASEKALSEVFRKKLDPKNQTGQGYLLSGLDKVTSGVQMMRQFKPVGWFVPFVLTPINILKKGIEYSPAGVGTLIGSTKKAEQLSKAFIGSMVFGAGAWMALNGRSTWAVPKDAKEKELFYASGKNPYSLKIGDKWVSYSKLGPLSYPLAMASALQYYWNENPKDETSLKKAVNILTSIAGFFADQSYVKGMANLMGTLSGDEQAIKDAATNIPSQLVPLSALERWVAQLIDPVYRKPASGLTVESLVQNLQKGIPFASKELESYTTPSGEPSVKKRINLFSPFDIGTSNEEMEKLSKSYNKIKKIRSISASEKEVESKKVSEELKKIKLMPTNKEKRDRLLELSKQDEEFTKKIISKFENEKLGLNYEEEAVKSLGVENGDRAKYIVDKIKNLPSNKEKRDLMINYEKKKILTDKVLEQVIYLLKK